MTWAGIPIAGAFVLGMIAGTAATIRIVRHVLEYVRRDQQPGG